ncbi:hypothetical protein HCA44_01400 [Rhodococcus sp. HNM0569]|nr:hypothetical protein [Rhodococcus sp. HNM0569]NLU81434.1 hypothetical protein [Rhodococcus sp. HNM0569]
MLILVALGASGLFTGIALVSDSSGRTMGWDTSMLPDWHTWDYRWAGLFTLVAFGVLPLLCAAGIVYQAPHMPLAAAGIGLLLVVWVVWQIVVLEIRAPYAHLVLAAAGLVLAATGVRRRGGAD